MRLILEFRSALRATAPWAASALVFAAGVMLLVSGATPTEAERLRWLSDLFGPRLVDVSHFLASLAGLFLLLVAWGLKRRLDAAWAAALAVTAGAGVLSLTKGFNWEETWALGAVVAYLAVVEPAFRRRAALSRMEITPGWMISAAAVVAGSAALALFSFDSLKSDAEWWNALTGGGGEAGRVARTLAGVGAALFAVGVWRLVATPATPRIIGDDDPDFTRVRAVLAAAEDPSPEANVALLGDKRFLFSESGRSFLMFGVRGRAWIALGAPVGLRSERQALMWRFRELADAHAARPAFYGVDADLLPELIDMGFALQKVGEYAVVPLDDFSVAGRRREVLRRNWRKAGEGGARFEVVPADQVAGLVEELRAVSDAWLAQQPGGGDKGFSLGGFHERYVCEFPCAVVRAEGRVVAFATLWTTPGRTALSMDLMRYVPDAPKNVMDFLFVELLLWARAEGYRAFEFGTAPLAGLSDKPLAPLMTRFGRFVFDKGEEFYNFQGVRRYKDKYDPVWRSRYAAAPHAWAIPFVLADVALLSSGGVSGLTKRRGEGGAPPPR